MKKPSLVICFLFCLSCFIAQTNGRQAEVLGRFRMAKLQRKVAIDRSFDEKIEIMDEARVLPQEGLKEKDRIKRLPGQPPVRFSQYGGYVTVDESAGRALYYYFAESHYNKKSKPLLLWLNGAMEELGPFRVKSDGKTLYENPFAWNKVANVLFLESPAGVGFSYSNRTSDYATRGDRNTAEDNYVFLVNWLERFPEYKTRDFYIAGESYAGHYVPQFAHTILQHNKISQKNIINLKGIMIGNAVINDETDTKGMLDYFWTHALTSDEDKYAIDKYCDFSPGANITDKCIEAVNEDYEDIDPIDMYNIYAPLCHSSNLTEKPKLASIEEFDPCTDYYVYAYLNRPDVQNALHANVTKLKYDWQPCSDVLNNWTDSPSTILPLLQEFMANGLRVWVYSGDVDARVPVTSTRYSLNKLQLAVNTSWYPWALSNEVGGYSVVYKGNLTFATVRGAGHEVPSYQPRRGLALIYYYLQGGPLPKMNISN
uniref:Carboxypeptidase n=1 Tax=Nelumbo nucifera TaxID=4432 RepID=A0A822ZC32_NELNU|nr:TPA_asm: hypothetical protein HUJ06_000697 [Nelumbo nucifera]